MEWYIPPSTNSPHSTQVTGSPVAALTTGSSQGVKRSYSTDSLRRTTISPPSSTRLRPASSPRRRRLLPCSEDTTSRYDTAVASDKSVPSSYNSSIHHRPSDRGGSSSLTLKEWANDWSHPVNICNSPLLKLQDNDYYSNSYGKLWIHEDMLGDDIRTNTYRKAILDNAHLFQDKTVLDVGSGTGILSLFAAQAGAKHVYGIECSEIVDVARVIASTNGFSDRITYIKGKVEEIELPVDKVDIIISEWMGYCLLYEGMLDSVILARNKWLSSNGYMLPDRAQLYVAGISNWDELDYRNHAWDSVGDTGVCMSCVKEELKSEPSVTEVSSDNICTSTACLLELDLYQCNTVGLDFVSHFQLCPIRRDIITGLVLWFDVSFTFSNNPTANTFTLTTGPDSRRTHWQQTVLYFTEFCPITYDHYNDSVEDKLHCSLGIRKSPYNPRDLDIKVVYKHQMDTLPHNISSSSCSSNGVTKISSVPPRCTVMYRMR